MLEDIIHIFYVAGSVEQIEGDDQLYIKNGARVGTAWLLAILLGVLCGAMAIPFLKMLFPAADFDVVMLSSLVLIWIFGFVVYRLFARSFTQSRVDQICQSKENTLSKSSAKGLAFLIVFLWLVLLLISIFVLLALS